MRFYHSSMLRVLFAFFIFFLLSCQSTNPWASKLVDAEGKYNIRLVPESLREEITQYSSRGITRIYKGESLEKKNREDVDFEVMSKVVQVQPLAKRITFHVKTISKAGQGNLHEFAAPELNETIEFEMDDKANVYKAGIYPRNSVFFVAPISLPKEPVKVGESWVYKSGWVTETNQLPLEIEVVTIFEKVFSCEGGQCALFEISGDVKIAGLNSKEMKLDSQIKGKMIFSLSMGTVVWSHVINEQLLQAGEFRAKSNSCLITRLKKPVWKKLIDQADPFCKAESQLADIRVPINL